MNDRLSVTRGLEVILELYDFESENTTAATKENIHQQIVDGAADLFACDVARFAVATQEQLLPAASTDEESLDECKPIPVSAGHAGKAYQTGKIDRVDDLSDTRSIAARRSNADNSDLPFDNVPLEVHRSLLSIPIEDFGVLQLFAREPAAFSDLDIDTAELFAAHVHTALKHLDDEAAIRKERNRFEEFANFVSHDLRNPLQILRGALDRTKETGDLEHLDQANQAIGRMESLIEDLLILAKKGSQITETRLIALDTIVEECWETSITGDATLSVTTDMSLKADPERFKQLLENLFRNAVEHGGSHVTVTVGEIDNGFFVEDDGLGISNEDPELIFSNGYSTKNGGTGLGLAIVAKIVDAHGWVITVAESETGGARFEITGVDTPTI